MYGGKKAISAYQQMTNLESNPLRQVVMLFDGAMKFLNLAASDIELGNLTAKAEHIDRAVNILSYLQSILDFDRGGEIARIYDRLYTSVTSMVVKASLTLDATTLRHAAQLLSPVREAWATNADLSDQRPAPVSVPTAPLPAPTPLTRHQPPLSGYSNYGHLRTR